MAYSNKNPPLFDHMITNDQIMLGTLYQDIFLIFITRNKTTLNHLHWHDCTYKIQYSVMV